MAGVFAVLRRHWVLAATLLVGSVLRVGMWIAEPRPNTAFSDAWSYVDAAREFLFRPQMGRTAAYPFVLRELHAIWPNADLPIVLQHVGVIAACGVLYWTLLRVGVPRAAAAAPAMVWALSVDWIWLEHQFMTEAFAALMLVCALAVVVIPREPRGWRGILIGVLAGVLVLAAGLVRPALLAAVPGAVLAVLLLLESSLRWRVAATIACVAVVAGGFVSYLRVQQEKTGYHGFVGLELDLGNYTTAAPYADCRKFTPPPGTRVLCESTPTRTRPGPDYYYWNDASPGRRLYYDRPDLRPAIRLWGERAVAADTSAVWEERLNAVKRMFGLSSYVRPLTDAGPDQMNLLGPGSAQLPVVGTVVEAYYGRDALKPSATRWPYTQLAHAQEALRLPGLLILVAFVLTAVGAIAGLGRSRRAALAVGAMGWLPILNALYVATQYNWRYVLAGLPLAVAAAVAGATALGVRVTALRGRAVPDREATEAPGAPRVARPRCDVPGP